MFKMFTKIKEFLITKPIIKRLLFFSVILGTLVPRAKANASVLVWLGTAALGLIGKVAGVGLQAILIIVAGFAAISYIAGFLLDLSIALLKTVTSSNFITLSYTNPSGPEGNPILAAGWIAMRDLANIGFVIVLIIIGLATALRIREYQWQRLLPKLIIVILLINFTPVIVGLVVDASNIVMNHFLRATEWGGFSTVIKNEVSITNIFGLLADVSKKIFSPSEIAPMVVFWIYAFTTSAILFVYSLLYIMRYVAIWVLVILSPLAFFAWILPTTKQYFRMWWKQLLHWSFIGAIAAFFLYLANITLTGVTTRLPIGVKVEGLEASGLINNLLPYFIIIVFLYLAFFVGLKTSAYGANTIIGWAKRREKGFVRWTGRKAQVGAQVAIKSERFKKIADRIATAPTVFGKLIRPLGRAMQKLPGEQDKIFDKAESDAKNMDAARVATQVTKGTIPFLREPGRVAGLLSGAAEDLDKAKDIIEKYNISPKEILDAIKWTRGQGKIDKAKKMFRGYSETLKEKGFRPEDVGLKFDFAKEKDREEAKEYGMKFGDAKKAGLSEEMAKEYDAKYKKHGGYLGKMLAEARTVDEIKSFKKILKSDESWVQSVIHKFWDGTQLHRAGEEIGAAFIEKFQDNAKDEFDYIRENPKMHKYLSSTAAQSAGYSFGSSKIDRIRKLAEEDEGRLKLEMAVIKSNAEEAKGKKRQDLINELLMYERVLATKKAKEWKEKEKTEIGAPKEAEAKKAKTEKEEGKKPPRGWGGPGVKEPGKKKKPPRGWKGPGVKT